jgi:hypothetical protein
MPCTIPYREASASYRTFLGMRANACGYFLAIQAIFINGWFKADNLNISRFMSIVSIIASIIYFIIVWRLESLCLEALESASKLEDLETVGLTDTKCHPMKLRWDKSKNHGFLKIDFLLPVLLIFMSIAAWISPHLWGLINRSF